jgi:hypothetical protein
MVLRYICAIGIFAIVAVDRPASALTPAEKMDTCKFGADSQKLVGPKRKRFISKCMSDAPARRPAIPAAPAAQQSM